MAGYRRFKQTETLNRHNRLMNIFTCIFFAKMWTQISIPKHQKNVCMLIAYQYNKICKTLINVSVKEAQYRNLHNSTIKLRVISLLHWFDSSF
jgi:hypothetical protein